MKHRNKKYRELRRFMKSQGVVFDNTYVTYNPIKKRNDVMMPATIGGQKIVTNGRDNLDAVRKYYKLWRDSVRMQKYMAAMAKKEDRYMRFKEKQNEV